MGETVTLPGRMRISHSSDTGAARRWVREVAVEVGFDPRPADELALAASELATNIVKHAGSGMLLLSSLDDEAGGGLRLEAVDNGPGIRDFEEALTDGFSTKGSLGYGLGTVHRLMDGFELIRPEEGGVRLVCVRRLKRPEHPEGQSLIDIGAATRAYPGMEQNGDAFVIHRWGEGALVGVIDGLGHGQFAHRAAQKASQYIDSHYDQLLPDIFRNVGRTCRATRGIVMALAAFDCGRGTLSFASVGNVEARVYGASPPPRFAVRRGIIGKSWPNPVVSEHPWNFDHVLVLHSDGIVSSWRWEQFTGVLEKPAGEVARQLLRSLARDTDDATVVVVKGGRR